MKKVSVIVVIVGLVVSLAGCSMPLPVADSGTEVAPSSSLVMDTASEAPASGEEPTQSSEPEQASSLEAEQPASSSSSASQSTGNGPGGSSSQAQTPASSQPAATSPPPAASSPQPAAPQPAPASSQPPAEPPAAKTAYNAPYDTGTILADAQSYGASIGMTWSDGLNTDNCSWEAPISTSTVLCGDRLKEAIESGIRRVQKLQQDNGYQPGEFHFRLYMEASGGEYTLYFLMG